MNQTRDPWSDEDLQTLCPFTMLEIAVNACENENFFSKISFKFVMDTLKSQGFDINDIIYLNSEAPLLGVASLNKNFKAIKELVSMGADMERFKHFPITAAIKANDPDFLNFLIDDCGMNVLEFVNKDPAVTLHSLEQPNPAVFDMLVEIGFDPNTRGSENQTLLMFAADTGRYQTADRLIERFNVDVNAQSDAETTALSSAVYKDDITMIQLSIKKGADVNFKVWDRYTIFEYACAFGRFKAAKLLYELLKPDVNALDSTNLTPLIHSINNNDMDFVQFFVEEGADIHQIVGSNSTPLNYAFMNNCHRIAEYLISLGCSLNTLTPGAARLPIHDVVKQEFFRTNPEDLPFVMGLGADVNGRDCNGDTALHYACRESKLNFIDPLVLQYGADVNAQNDLGQRFIDLVDNNDEILRFLLEHGSELE